MSTSCLVGRLDPATGEYTAGQVGLDGYPTAKGPFLAELVGRADGDLAAVLRTVVDQHSYWYLLAHVPDGVTVPGPEYVTVPGYGMAIPAPAASFPRGGVLGEPHGPGVAWLYLFTGTDAATAELLVVDHDGVEVDRVPVAGLADVPARRWIDMECGPGLERCSHYAWVHFEVPEASRRLGTDTWLGRRPMLPHEATGVLHEGVVWNFPPDRLRRLVDGVYHVTIVHPDTGAQAEVAASRLDDRGREQALPGVELVGPPRHPDPDNALATRLD